jgi:diguanylate cyclase (GGDEF)-like protein
MQKPELPIDENHRLETLRSLKLLDSAPEERFDRLTRLAKRLFGVPICLVSIVDANRQWFKSAQGLAAPETSRDISFCGHAILGDKLFIVPNTLKDKRFADNPLVLEDPNIRFYAGYPLKVMNGSKIGTLCIIDREPREFSDEDYDLLKDLAAMAEQEIAAVQLASLDELTLISNRRGFNSLAQHSLNLCRRNNTNIELLFFDLDDFKQINDKYGHAEGDKALIAFAEIMREVLRDSDVFARIGGDEFVALLSVQDNVNSTDVLIRFQQAINNYNKQSNRGYELKYSVGCIFTSVDEGATIDRLLNRADKKMYIQKQDKKSLKKKNEI